MNTINPFFNESRIQDSEYFFDREQEVAKVMDKLAAGNQVDVFGERKIGKSSLVSYILSRREYVQRIFANGREVLVAYVDCEKFGYTINSRLFYENLLRALRPAGKDHPIAKKIDEFLDRKCENAESLKLQTYDLLLYEVLRVANLLVVLEEVEVFETGNAEIGFIPQLRALTQESPNIRFLVTCRDSLRKKQSNGVVSHFYNVFTDVPLMVFSGELRGFPEHYLNIALGKAHIDRNRHSQMAEAFTAIFSDLLEYAGSHPYYIMKICSICFDRIKTDTEGNLIALHEQEGRNRIIASLVSEFVGQLRDDYHRLAQRLYSNSKYKDVLYSLEDGGYDYAVANELENMAVIVPDRKTKDYRFVNRTFESYWRRNFGYVKFSDGWRLRLSGENRREIISWIKNGTDLSPSTIHALADDLRWLDKDANGCTIVIPQVMDQLITVSAEEDVNGQGEDSEDHN